MSNDSHPHKRTQLLVDPLFQGRILGRVGLYWVMYHLTLFMAVFVYHYWLYRDEVMAGSTAPAPFADLFMVYFWNYVPIVLVAGLAFPLLVIDLLRLTHRVSGPLLRFRTTLSRMNDGERAEAITLRKHDFLKDFQAVFNEHLDEFNNLRQYAEANLLGSESETETTTEANFQIDAETSAIGPSDAELAALTERPDRDETLATSIVEP